MNCRTFHRNLEDYLEGGLDFSRRFGMERHAKQCIGCGEELAGAQRLRRMASELKRVKAPPNFEFSVLNEIAKHKSRNRFPGIRSLWIYGIEWPSWRKLALASSSLIILGFGIFYASYRVTPDIISPPPLAVVKPSTTPAKMAEIPAKIIKTNPQPELVASSKQPPAKQPKAAEALNTAAAIDPPIPFEEVGFQDPETADMEFVKYEVLGADNRLMPVRVPRPKKIWIQYGQLSEEEFLRNVSH
jgi:hypothetical protein